MPSTPCSSSPSSSTSPPASAASYVGIGARVGVSMRAGAERVPQHVRTTGKHHRARAQRADDIGGEHHTMVEQIKGSWYGAQGTRRTLSGAEKRAAAARCATDVYVDVSSDSSR